MLKELQIRTKKAHNRNGRRSQAGNYCAAATGKKSSQAEVFERITNFICIK
jgi:hypothetical protein